MVLTLILRSFMHFQLTFVWYVRPGVQLNSSSCGYQIIPVSSVKEVFMFPLNGLETLAENQLAIDVWYFFMNSQIYSISLYISLCFDYHSFVLRFEIGNCESSHFFFFFFFRLFWFFGAPYNIM